LFNSKTICIHDNGLHLFPKEYSAYIYSVLVHLVVLLLLFSISPTIKTFPEKQIVKIISAKLFYNKSTAMPVNDHKVKEQILNIEEKTSNNASGSKVKKAIKPINQSKTEKTTEAVGRVKTSKNITSTVSQKTLSSSNTLQSLREKIDKESYKQQSKAAYESFVRSKNSLARSTTKFEQLPEAKAVEVNVSCNNTLNKSITIMSGLLGGTIKCNSFNESQKHIDRRLDKLGVKR